MKRFQRAFAFLLLVALVFAGAAAAEENGKLQVHFLRIGRNDGILISMNGETAFIDGGHGITGTWRPTIWRSWALRI